MPLVTPALIAEAKATNALLAAALADAVGSGPATAREIERLTDRFPVCRCRDYNPAPFLREPHEEGEPDVCERCVAFGASRGKSAASCHRLTWGWPRHEVRPGVFVGPTETRERAAANAHAHERYEAEVADMFGGAA